MFFFRGSNRVEDFFDARAGRMIDERGGLPVPPVETGGYKMLDVVSD